MSLTEVLWRLINPGETALDIGANIGYMTSIMAKRVGKTGKVFCFEPNLEVYAELCENINNWQQNLGVNNINAQQIALSNHAGSGVLNLTSENRGEAFIDVAHDISAKSNSLVHYSTVTMERLDKVLETEQKNIGV
ncbi:FkbM family methyltransferase [Dolichospermum circinale CS-545/17]|nr:FkbM family methyltransferase [Dolichospermum circinale CS-545/17]